MFGVPMPDASLYLTEEVKAALLGQVSEVANLVCDSMLVAGATMLLENGHRISGPGDVSGFVDHPITMQDPRDARLAERTIAGSVPRQVMAIGTAIVMGRPADHSSDVV